MALSALMFGDCLVGGGMCSTDDFLIFTVRLHVMQCTVLLSQFCPSVCLSVRQMRVLWQN